MEHKVNKCIVNQMVANAVGEKEGFSKGNREHWGREEVGYHFILGR